MSGYFVQVINPNGGEYGMDRIPVAVNRRYFVAIENKIHRIPEIWKMCYPPHLFGHIAQQPNGSSGEFQGFGWIKE